MSKFVIPTNISEIEAAQIYSDNWEDITELDYENSQPDEVNKLDFINGVKWEKERITIEIEEKWLEYRNRTNNEDAWMFKEWLTEQFKKNK